MVSKSELRELTDWKAGRISAQVMFDEDLYRQEQDRVFGRSWLVVGHEDMVRKPGDYITNYMGEVPVIVARDMKGTIRVLVNRCAHRGNQVCLYDRGNARAFTCAYHGWTYDIDGSLIGVPLDKEIYRGELNKEEWGLEEVAQFTNFHGLLFATFDAATPSLEDWLGEGAAWYLENLILVDHLGGLEMMPGFHRYVTPGNWKLLAENFIGDSYHVQSTHAGAFRAARGLAAKEMSVRPVLGTREGDVHYEATAGFGHGAPMGMSRLVLGDRTYAHDLEQAELLGPDAVEWIRERYNRHKVAMADLEARPYAFMNGAVFPNLGLMGFASAFDGRIFLSFHPRGVWEMEQWQWTMVEREAPASVKEEAVQYVRGGQSMAGLIAPDDGENFERMVEAMRSPRNWKRRFHYGLQLGHEDEGPKGLPGIVSPMPSEINQRNFYRFWLELMETE